MRYPRRDLSLLILLLSLAVSLGWWKNENKHGSIWIQNDQELKALSLAEVGGGGRGGGVLFPSISHQIGTCMCCPKGYGFYAVSV